MNSIMGKWNPQDTPEAIRIANAQQMKENAEANDDYQNRCIMGEKVFFSKDTKGRFPGHIYSDLGISEFGISQMCEYHFDEATLPPDDISEESDEFESEDNDNG